MSKNLNILIVEDELLIAEMLKEMLLELEYTVAGVARDFDTAQKILKNNININFAILDINLNQSKNGIDIAKTLNIPFVFLTSYSEKTIIQEAIECKPQAYLIKPFAKTDLYTTLEIIKQKISMDAQLNSIVIKDGHLNVKILINSILWLKSENIYIEIKTDEKVFVIRNSLENFLEELNNPVFIRIHRSYAVNINHVKAINGQYVLVANQKLPLSRNLRNELMSRFTA